MSDECASRPASPSRCRAFFAPAQALDAGIGLTYVRRSGSESALQIEAGVIEVLQNLKALGVRLALDDFGTGYSSLGSIKCSPLDRLKIDRSFIRDLQHQAGDRSLIRAIISMGRALNLEIIAEGVETAAQLNFVCDAGCDEVQGYLVGKPMSALDFDRSFPDRIAKRTLLKPHRAHSLELEPSLQTA
jgi:EAL domain-containing protein (putative c-di-GMP-specific phosphodiesterase class I)